MKTLAARLCRCSRCRAVRGKSQMSRKVPGLCKFCYSDDETAAYKTYQVERRRASLLRRQRRITREIIELQAQLVQINTDLRELVTGPTIPPERQSTPAIAHHHARYY